MLRFLLVGTGFGEEHARWLANSDGAEVAAIGYRKDHQRAKALAKQHEVPTITDDPLNLIKKGGIEAVAIVSPPESHEALCAAGLSAGLLVVSDKPLAADIAAARRLAALAKGNAGRAAVTFQWRTHPALRQLRERCLAGEFGTIQHLDLEFHHDFLAGPATAWPWRHAAAAAGAGTLGDQGIHLLDLVRWLVPGSWEVEAARTSVTWPVRESSSGPVTAQTEDMAEVWLDDRAGSRTARVFTSRVSTGFREVRVLVQGSEGAAIAAISPDDGSGGVRFRAGAVPGHSEFGPTDMNPYQSILGTGDSAAVASFEDGYAAQELMAAALTAARNNGTK